MFIVLNIIFSAVRHVKLTSSQFGTHNHVCISYRI